MYVCVRVQVTQMKHRLIQTIIERAFLRLIKNSVRRIELSQKGTKVCKCQEQVGSGKPVLNQEHWVKLPAQCTRGKPVVSQEHRVNLPAHCARGKPVLSQEHQVIDRPVYCYDFSIESTLPGQFVRVDLKNYNFSTVLPLPTLLLGPIPYPPYLSPPSIATSLSSLPPPPPPSTTSLSSPPPQVPLP